MLVYCKVSRTKEIHEVKNSRLLELELKTFRISAVV